MKTAVLLSGGVDSSVALYLLKKQGYDVTAFYLKVWLEDELSFLGDCPWGEDLEYAQQVCKDLDVQLMQIQMQKDYLDTVVEYTIKELKAGRTPSPDVMCNRHIKFGKFINKIDSSFELIASGHYAQVENKDGKYYLKSAPDAVKDQTYFLTYLTQEQLSKITFPIGQFNKSEVRQLAQEFNLPTKERKDSQGICFLGKIPYNEFIKYHLGEKQGDVIDIQTGKKISTHNGYWFFTIGQRHGLGLGGGPWYIVKKDIEQNIIYISTEKMSLSVLRDKFIVRDVNWIPEFPTSSFDKLRMTEVDSRQSTVGSLQSTVDSQQSTIGSEDTSFDDISVSGLQVKLRHGPKKYDCDIDKIDETSVIVQLSGKDEGIAAGQFAVFYNGEYCLGGGVIELITKKE